MPRPTAPRGSCSRGIVRISLLIEAVVFVLLVPRLLFGYGVTIAAFKRDSEAWKNADADTVLQAGDTILVVGPTSSAENFAQLR